jgi:hypothetical protein
LICSRTGWFGADLVVDITLDATGPIERSECRRDGQLVRRVAVDTWTSAADVHVLTLELFVR